MNSDPQASPRLAVVLTHATQYYSPWFRWLREHTELCFKVFYLSDIGLEPSLDQKFGRSFAWDVDLTSGYDWEIVPNAALKPDTLRFGGINNPSLHRRLAEWQPDAILLFGYKYRTHLKLIAWAALHHIPLIFRGDSHLLGHRRMPLLKRFLLRKIYERFAAITYVGESNRKYFKSLGVDDSRLFFAPHSVDDSLFARHNTQHHQRAAELRQQIDLGPSTRVALFAGKLVPSKQPHALLEAFAQLAIEDSALIFVGDGEERSLLEARAAAAPNLRVHFLPFTNQSAMPARYLLADVFVLPSRGHYETWGLAVNEAMHMGVPCLVSNLVGCQADLVTDAKTGWVFDASKHGDLRAKLYDALTLPSPERQTMREAVLQRILKYTYRQTAEGLQAALERAVSHDHAKRKSAIL
ncbi:MAG: glycosyltransferase family 4 protein [Nibricoccus sp.]